MNSAQKKKKKNTVQAVTQNQEKEIPATKQTSEIILQQSAGSSEETTPLVQATRKSLKISKNEQTSSKTPTKKETEKLVECSILSQFITESTPFESPQASVSPLVQSKDTCILTDPLFSPIYPQQQSGAKLLVTSPQLTKQTSRKAARQQLNYTDDTSLTNTWSLCTETQKPPTPPQEIVDFFRALKKPNVQRYISTFIDYYESIETRNSEDSQSWSYMELLGNENIPSTPWPQSSAQQCTEDLQGPSMSAMVAPQPTVEIKKSIFPMQMVPQPNQTLQCSGSAQMVPDLQGPLSQGSNMPMTTQQQWCASNLQGRTVPIQVASELQNSNAVDSDMPETQPSATRSPGSKPGELRRSPRKNQKPVVLADEIPDDNGKVALLKQYPNVKVDAKQLRAAKKAAVSLGGDKASYKLSSKIVKQLFTTKELANSRGLGLRGKKDTSDVRLPLDECRVNVLKAYVSCWCKINGKGDSRDKDINGAITELISYARKKLRIVT